MQSVLSDSNFTERDALIVAGDISSNLDLVRQTLVFLKTIFHTVCYCPGNNELRLNAKERKKIQDSYRNNNKKLKNSSEPILEFADSLEKFHYIMDLCKQVGVTTEPIKLLGQVWIVPLFAWYTPHFDPNWDGDHSYQVLFFTHLL